MATINSPSDILSAPVNLKRWTVEEYHRLSELGLLAPGKRTELIAGQILIKPVKSRAHVVALQLLARQIKEFLRDQPFFARAQDPIQLDDLSEPEPDLVIVQGEVLTYASRHPQPEDVSLIVEVADSTLKQDCSMKATTYAQVNIAEYWVLDLQYKRLHVFQKPTATGYGSHLILMQDNKVSPLAFPALVLDVASLFPPVH